MEEWPSPPHEVDLLSKLFYKDIILVGKIFTLVGNFNLHLTQSTPQTLFRVSSAKIWPCKP